MMPADADTLDLLAAWVHERLRSTLDPGSPWRTADYRDLPEHLQAANRAQVLASVEHLRSLGFAVEADAAGPDDVVALTDDEVERAARAEHQRWVSAKVADGYRFGAVRDDAARVHPALVGWDEIDEETRERDRERVRLAPVLAARLGYRVRRPA